MSFQITIEAMSNTPTPTIAFGFSNEMFSQAVFINPSRDPIKVLEMANLIHEQFVKACAAAVMMHTEGSNDENRNVS